MFLYDIVTVVVFIKMPFSTHDVLMCIPYSSLSFRVKLHAVLVSGNDHIQGDSVLPFVNVRIYTLYIYAFTSS